MKSYEEEDFSEYYTKFLKTKISQARYIDPDSVRDISKTSFYKDLCCFLNSREKDFEKKGVFLPPKKSKGVEKEEYENVWNCMDRTKIQYKNQNRSKMRITSDQFGFSAIETIFLKSPCNECYPLVKLNNLCENDEDRKFISTYIENTRTIGGSFVWPMQFGGSIYNIKRGVGSYIKDRVDLTLLEIKHYYLAKKEYEKVKRKNDFIDYFMEKYPDDVLITFLGSGRRKAKKIKKEQKLLIKWLDHFGGFEEYVNYMCLNSFVVIVNGEYYPIDIVRSTIDDQGEITKTPLSDNDVCSTVNEFDKLDKEGLIQMLKIVQKMTLERSEIILTLLSA